jgi:two-component system chemotaxis response regulator CheY
MHDTPGSGTALAYVDRMSPGTNGSDNVRSAGGHLILVEDDPAVRGVLALLLRSDGWRVLEAADGRAGLGLVRSMRADVVVTDLRMPGMSGLELAREVVESPGIEKVPVVAITSDTSDLRAVAERSGWFASVLSKPLAPADLLEAVREASAESL